MATLVFLCGPRVGPVPSTWGRACAMEMTERLQRRQGHGVAAFEDVRFLPPSEWKSAPWPARYVVTFRPRDPPGLIEDASAHP